jgi:hypothetical protein
MSRIMELNVKNHKRSVLMTGYLCGVRKAQSWTKGSQDPLETTANAKPPYIACAGDWILLRPGTWLKVSLKSAQEDSDFLGY